PALVHRVEEVVLLFWLELRLFQQRLQPGNALLGNRDIVGVRITLDHLLVDVIGRAGVLDPFIILGAAQVLLGLGRRDRAQVFGHLLTRIGSAAQFWIAGQAGVDQLPR